MKNHIITWGITVTGGIAAIIGAGWIAGWHYSWRDFLDLILRGWDFLFSDQTLVFDGWVILVLGILVLFGLLSAVLICLAKMQNKPKPEPYQKCEGTMYGLKWRWEQHEDQVEKLRGFCPKCDLELEIDDNYYRETEVYCERCKGYLVELPARYERAIIREIQRQYRAKQNSP